MLELDLVIRFTTAVVALIAFIYGLIWYLKHKDFWYVVMPILTLLGHTLIFYSFIIYRYFAGLEEASIWGIPASTFDSTWSAILRLHSIVTFFFVLVIARSCIKTIPKVNKWIQPKL